MSTKKIIQLYQALDAAELKQLFLQFSQGGKAGMHQKEYDLLHYLGTISDLTSFSYADAAQVMNCSETNCRQIAKRLSQAIEQLFVHQYIDTHPRQKLLIQLAALDERGCFERIKTDLRKHQKSFSSLIQASATISDAILYRYRLAEWKRTLIVQHPSSRTNTDEESSSLIEMSEFLELFALIEHIRLATALKSSKSQLDKTYAATLPDLEQKAKRLKEICDAQAEPEKSLVSCYLFAYQMAFEEEKHDPSLPHPLWTLLQQYIHQLPSDDRINLFRIYLNKNIRQYNKHKDKAQATHMLHVYKWGIDQGLLEENGYLTPAEFKNYLTLCLLSEHLEEAREFLKSHGPRLPQESRDNYIRFCKGLYFFKREDYSQVLALFSQKFEEIEWELQSKLLHAQAEWSLLPLPRNQIQAIPPILRKLKPLFKQAKKHKQLGLSPRILYFQMVVRARGNQEILRKIQDEMLAHPPFPGKDWILGAIYSLLYQT